MSIKSKGIQLSSENYLMPLNCTLGSPAVEPRKCLCLLLCRRPSSGKQWLRHERVGLALVPIKYFENTNVQMQIEHMYILLAGKLGRRKSTPLEIRNAFCPSCELGAVVVAATPDSVPCPGTQIYMDWNGDHRSDDFALAFILPRDSAVDDEMMEATPTQSSSGDNNVQQIQRRTGQDAQPSLFICRQRDTYTMAELMLHPPSPPPRLMQGPRRK